jgi:hypothetical protein
MKNKFTHNVTLRELIEICNQIKPDARRDSTYISFKTYLPKTRQEIINKKRLIRKNGEYSLPIGSEPEADNIINISQNHHTYKNQNSSFEIEWIFSDEQRKYSQIKGKHHYLRLIRTESGELKPLGENSLEFIFNPDEQIIKNLKEGEIATLDLSQEEEIF